MCKNIIHIIRTIIHPACSVMTKLQYTALAYPMILHLPSASTCYDKLIINYKQQLEQLTYHNLPYHTRRMTSNYMPPDTLQEPTQYYGLYLVCCGLGQVLWLESCNCTTLPYYISLTWPLLKWLYQSRIFHKRKKLFFLYTWVHAGRLMNISSIYARFPLQAFYSVLPRFDAIAVWICCLIQA